MTQGQQNAQDLASRPIPPPFVVLGANYPRNPSVAGNILTVTIQSLRYLDDGRLEVIVSATNNGIDLPLNNPFYFVNPFMVFDTLNPLQPDIVQANPDKALKENVISTLLTIINMKK